MSEGALITRKRLNLIAKRRGIKETHNMSTDDLINTLSRQDSKHESYSIRRTEQTELKCAALNMSTFLTAIFVHNICELVLTSLYFEEV